MSEVELTKIMAWLETDAISNFQPSSNVTMPYDPINMGLAIFKTNMKFSQYPTILTSQTKDIRISHNM
jgi:hypothetical protein